MKRTLYDKLWEKHLVVDETTDHPAIIYIDLHLIHEVTSPQAFAMLRDRGLSVRRPDLTFATMDHSSPTIYPKKEKNFDHINKDAKIQLETLKENCDENKIELFDVHSEKNGIVHVIGPELGLSQPGKTIVCGDSHTSTHGAFAALAFGIGTSEVGYVLATQCLLQRKSKQLQIKIDGKLATGVTAKDLILFIISKIGVNGGTGHVIEYSGSTISTLSMEERMTVCNMSIEAGARAGLIAVDDITINYLQDKQYSPKAESWDKATEEWKNLKSDSGAKFDKIVEIDASKITPMITYGTNPEMAIDVSAKLPDTKDNEINKALRYMNLKGGNILEGEKINKVFIGSCTNSRISDLRDAAKIFKQGHVAENVSTIIVPGSFEIKKLAESEGLDKIFIKAGAEWREPGCSMCIAMNGDKAEEGELVVSTSNRNFEGRQGKGSRTILASPLTAAASAIEGKIADPRRYLEEK
jgi:3-isopropylmalate/(R)-2-methylmalate dehydratase large subunit